MSKVKKDFDWDLVEGKGFGGSYTADQKEKMEAAIEATLNSVTEKEVVKGIVVSKTDREVIINIGFKSDGLVSASEFRDMPDLKAGDEVEVYIENQEDANGQLTLSRKLAKVMGAWTNIEKALEEDTIINGFVKRRTKGGLIVDIFGIEAFLPGSQIDVKPIRDFDIFVGKNMEVKVVKINHTNDNVVVSHKVLIEKDLEAQRQLILNNLDKGQVLEGVIKNMTNFGVFIDLGGVDGLIHITDLSWGRINHPEEVLKLDDRIQVVILDYDDTKKRISLGLKPSEKVSLENLPQIRLENGDKISIPPRPDFVQVFGSVNTESALVYRSGLSVKDYLNQAGVSGSADINGAILVRSDGSALSNQSYWSNDVLIAQVFPGDTIVIPEKFDRESGWSQTIRNAKDFTQVLYQLGLGAAAIKTLRQ